MRKPLIIILVLSVAVLTGCEKANEPSYGNRDDPVENMIYAKSIEEYLPKGAMEFVVEELLRKIEKRAEEVGRDIENAFIQWDTLGLEPKAYCQAANIILENLERNNHQWLTIGNIIIALGYPDSIKKLDHFLYDSKGTVNADAVRFELYYKNGGVLLKITSSGFLNELSYKAEGAFIGMTPIHWPHDYSFASDHPLVTGKSLSNNQQETLLHYADRLIGNSVENDMPAYIHSIVLMDCISDTLAIIYFVLKGEYTLHHHMWFDGSDGEWKRITDQEAFSMIMERQRF